jgi:hypothetical protein
MAELNRTGPHGYPKSLPSPIWALLLLGLLATQVSASERSHLLRWIAPPEPDVAGYELYLALDSMAYEEPVDLGYVVADPNGIASTLLEGLDASLDYYVVMTAYDAVGNVSDLSNELIIPALACDPSGCDDGNPCSVDGCSQGRCTNDLVPEGTACDDGSAFTVNDICTDGVCIGLLPQCTSDLACDDGNACNGEERCIDFVCQGGVPLDCSSLGDQCTTGVCDEDARSCVVRPANEGGPCDDRRSDTIEDHCEGGTCVGRSPLCGSDAACEDGNPCTVDRCDSITGCVSSPAADGTACEDGRFCTTGDVCRSGVCGRGERRDCSALADPCTRGVCNERARTCVARPDNRGKSCDDGDPETLGDHCDAGTCVGAPASGVSCDVNGDEVVDRDDVRLILQARRSRADGPTDPRDIDGDGWIGWSDRRICFRECTLPRCRRVSR